MPPFMKDELKKKYEQKLDDMQREIDEEESPAAVYESAYAATSPNQEKSSGDASPTEENPSEVSASAEEKLAAEAANLTATLKETEGSLKRLRADFENYRRRTAKEKEELSSFVAQEIIKDMLPLVDNFERAMASENTDPDAFKKGVEMIYNQMAEVLKKHGLEAIDTEGAKFDPNFHQAVMRVENPDLEEGSIVACMQKGYTVKGRVIRPSMVQVVGD